MPRRRDPEIPVRWCPGGPLRAPRAHLRMSWTREGQGRSPDATFPEPLGALVERTPLQDGGCARGPRKHTSSTPCPRTACTLAKDTGAWPPGCAGPEHEGYLPFHPLLKRWLTAKQKQNAKPARSPPETHTPHSQTTYAMGLSRATTGSYWSNRGVSNSPRTDAACWGPQPHSAEAGSRGGRRREEGLPVLAARPPPEAPASYVQALNERPGRSARGLAPARICGDPQGERSCKGEAAGKSAQDRPGFPLPRPAGGWCNSNLQSLEKEGKSRRRVEGGKGM